MIFKKQNGNLLNNFTTYREVICHIFKLFNHYLRKPDEREYALKRTRWINIISTIKRFFNRLVKRYCYLKNRSVRTLLIAWCQKCWKTISKDFRSTGVPEPRQVTYPCKCAESQCSCCSGNVLQNFNFNFRQRLCTNISYSAEDFEFNVRILFNDYTLYHRVVSGAYYTKCIICIKNS